MKKGIIYKKLSVIIVAILLIFSFINVALTQDQTTGKSENKTEKSESYSSKKTSCSNCESCSSKKTSCSNCEFCSSKKTSCSNCKADGLDVAVNVSNWFNQAFLNLVDNKNYNLNLSNEALVFFLDKETVRDYVQIRNFKSWLTKEGYNNIQFVVFVNGKENEKTQLVNLVKQIKLDMALWPTSNLVSSLGVKKYPTVYYIVNGVVVNTTNKLDQGHLKKLIGWCEHCKLTKAKDNCSMNEKNKKMEENDAKKEMKEDKKMNDNKSKKKEKSCNCGDNCNCGCKEGKECKCGH
jgi:hypothetical protein